MPDGKGGAEHAGAGAGTDFSQLPPLSCWVSLWLRAGVVGAARSVGLVGRTPSGGRAREIDRSAIDRGDEDPWKRARKRAKRPCFGSFWGVLGLVGGGRLGLVFSADRVAVGRACLDPAVPRRHGPGW